MRLFALLQGRAKAQHQSTSDTPDRSVLTHYTGTDFSALAAITAVEHGPDATDIVVTTEPHGSVTVCVSHVLRPGSQAAPTDALGQVTSTWRAPEGEARGSFAVLRTSR